MKIDLHVHSTASDGKLSPREVIDLAIERKIPVIALTDHDNVDGIKEALEYSQGRKIEFVQGIEFSANPGSGSRNRRSSQRFQNHLRLQTRAYSRSP